MFKESQRVTPPSVTCARLILSALRILLNTQVILSLNFYLQEVNAVKKNKLCSILVKTFVESSLTNNNNDNFTRVHVYS